MSAIIDGDGDQICISHNATDSHGEHDTGQRDSDPGQSFRQSWDDKAFMHSQLRMEADEDTGLHPNTLQGRGSRQHHMASHLNREHIASKPTQPLQRAGRKREREIAALRSRKLSLVGKTGQTHLVWTALPNPKLFKHEREATGTQNNRVRTSSFHGPVVHIE